MKQLLRFKCTLFSYWKWNPLTGILPVIIFFIISEVEMQMFTRSCNDPLVVDHINKFGHTYCYHACGLLEDGSQTDTTTCNAAGNCLCNYPCDSAPPANTFDSGVCPPSTADPPDNDPTALPRCMASCAATCAGGQGMVCSEVSALGPNNDIFGKICVCYCPPQPCTATTTTTIAPVVTTTALVPTTTTKKSVGIVLVKNPIWFLFPVKKLFLLLCKKIIKLCFALFKVAILYLIKSLLLALYYFLCYEWISWEISVLTKTVSWVIHFLFDKFSIW